MRVEQWPNGSISLRDEHGTERVWLWADGSIWFRDDGGRLRAEWKP